MVAWADGDSLDFFAAKVVPGKEFMAQRILENRKILARVPTHSYESRVHRKSKRKTTITRPWLVGLVFIAFPKVDMEGQPFQPPWFALKQRIHIIQGVIGMDHKPAKIDHEGLMRLFDDIVFSDIEVCAHLKTYHVDQRVRVTFGPFAGFDGVVKVIDTSTQDMVVMCQLFGRETPVLIQKDQLDRIEAVAA